VLWLRKNGPETNRQRRGDFFQFTLDNVDKVEVVRGAVESALYGTDAR